MIDLYRWPSPVLDPAIWLGIDSNRIGRPSSANPGRQCSPVSADGYTRGQALLARLEIPTVDSVVVEAVEQVGRFGIDNVHVRSILRSSWRHSVSNTALTALCSRCPKVGGTSGHAHRHILTCPPQENLRRPAVPTVQRPVT